SGARTYCYKVSGNLTMRGVTKPVVLDAEVAGTRQAPNAGWLAAVNMSGTVKRKDYGLMWIASRKVLPSSATRSPS
ncbi:MAG: YceI family protein, partial [Gemmatimonadaceae bacterium]|nr:YceI family protein [Gemmatimonadaceae bacterium]